MLNLVHHFLHVCSTCHTIFSLKKTLECVCERLLYFRLIFSYLGPPANNLNKLSVTQSIVMYHSVLKVVTIVGLRFSKLSFKVAYFYILTQNSDMFTKSSDMLNKNILGKKCEANKKQPYLCATKNFDISWVAS